MNSEEFRFTARDGQTIHCRKWVPLSTPKACVQIAHGMAEHCGRYGHLAGRLVEAGYAVYANDHRGHGKTAGIPENIGYFADENGFEKVVTDLHQLFDIIRRNNPDTRVFLLGHSMGSLLVRNFITRYGDEVAGVVLSGTMDDPGLLGLLGRWLARWECRRRGRRAQSPLMNAIAFGAFNKPFKPARTDFDWLSRDPEQVDRYVADPYCGGVFSAGFWVDFLTGLKETYNPALTARIPKHLPMFFFSGDRDPVGANGKGVKRVCRYYQAAGLTEVTLTLYPGGHHEMVNETNREEVIQAILDWLATRV
jgi:alpha-beta hydrolase superfamily lysophospholipase